MQAVDPAFVRVHAEWDGWQSAEVRLEDLHHIQWLQPARAHRAFLHGYVSCARIVAGDIPHNCGATTGPHTVLVCVLKSQNIPSLFAKIAQSAEGTAAHPVRQAIPTPHRAAPPGPSRQLSLRGRFLSMIGTRRSGTPINRGTD